MPTKYQIAADIIDIQSDTPTKEDRFIIDTNVWLWMTYTQASSGAKSYQITDYPSYVNAILEGGGSIFRTGITFSELAHQIERMERKIFNSNRAARGMKKINVKEFRHNHSKNRKKVADEIEAAWIQVKSLAEPIDITIDELMVDAALTRIKTQKADGYDLFILELMLKHNISQIITDDGDYATVPGIKVFTSNKSVIKAAKKQKKILTRERQRAR